jgi:non-ribosomal peptide synthetase component F
MGILRSGAAYVAIDPANPPARKAFIVKDAGLRVLIAQAGHLDGLDDYRGSVLDLDGLLAALPPGPPPGPVNRLSDLAYLVYTSGSTGMPKGVMVEHGSLLDHVQGALRRTNFGECRSFGLVSTLAADLGNTPIFVSLLIGAALHVFPEADVMDAGRIAAADLDCLKLVPSHWRALQQDGRLVAPRKALMLGGEPLTDEIMQILRAGNGQCQVYNHYGPRKPPSAR